MRSRCCLLLDYVSIMVVFNSGSNTLRFMTSCYREITRLGQRIFYMFLEILYLESGSLGRASYMFEKFQMEYYNLV